jgi:predicted small lipoprotein YifL
MPNRPVSSITRFHRLASLALLLLTLLSGCGTKGALYLPDPRTGKAPVTPAPGDSTGNSAPLTPAPQVDDLPR